MLVKICLWKKHLNFNRTGGVGSMGTKGRNGTAIRRENQEGMEPHTRQITAKSPLWINEFNQQKKSFVNAQNKRENALKVLADTIVFMEKLQADRGQ
jgi:hypothetical protein